MEPSNYNPPPEFGGTTQVSKPIWYLFTSNVVFVSMLCGLTKVFLQCRGKGRRGITARWHRGGKGWLLILKIWSSVTSRTRCHASQVKMSHRYASGYGKRAIARRMAAWVDILCSPYQVRSDAHTVHVCRRMFNSIDLKIAVWFMATKIRCLALVYDTTCSARKILWTRIPHLQRYLNDLYLFCVSFSFFFFFLLLLSDEGRNLNQLDDFMECLSKFTRYNSVRPLATLSYASDLYNGSSIVSRYDKSTLYFFSEIMDMFM